MRVTVDHGVELHVQDLGSGPPVVLLAGFGLDHRAWDRQVRILSGSHRVICVDQRGHGLSDKPLTGYEVPRLAEDLLAVLDALGIDRCAVVGWSFGGQVAFRAAAQDPKRIARLALVGSNGVRASRGDGFPFGRTPEQMLPALTRAEHDDRLAARRDTIRSGFAAEPAAALLDFLVGRSLSMPSWAAIACYEAMLHTDLCDEIDAVTCPVLQLIGKDDPVHSVKGARWLNQRLSAAQLVELDGCGHYPMYEAPDAFDEALGEFLTSS